MASNSNNSLVILADRYIRENDKEAIFSFKDALKNSTPEEKNLVGTYINNAKLKNQNFGPVDNSAEDGSIPKNEKISTPKNEVGETGENFSVLFAKFKEEFEKHNQKTAELAKIKEAIDKKNIDLGFGENNIEVKPIYLDAIDDPRVGVLIKTRVYRELRSIIESYNEKVKSFTEKADILSKEEDELVKILEDLLDKSRSKEEMGLAFEYIQKSNDTTLKEKLLNSHFRQIVKQNLRRIKEEIKRKVNKEVELNENTKRTIRRNLERLNNNSIEDTASKDAIPPIANSINKDRLIVNDSSISDVTIDNSSDNEKPIDSDSEPKTTKPLTKYDVMNSDTIDYSNGGIPSNNSIIDKTTINETSVKDNAGQENTMGRGIEIGFDNKNNSVINNDTTKIPDKDLLEPTPTKNSIEIDEITPLENKNITGDNPATATKEVISNAFEKQTPIQMIKFSPDGKRQDIAQNTINPISKTTEATNLATERVKSGSDRIDQIRNGIKPDLNSSNIATQNMIGPEIFAKPINRSTEPFNIAPVKPLTPPNEIKEPMIETPKQTEVVVESVSEPSTPTSETIKPNNELKTDDNIPITSNVKTLSEQEVGANSVESTNPPADDRKRQTISGKLVNLAATVMGLGNRATSDRVGKIDQARIEAQKLKNTE